MASLEAPNSVEELYDSRGDEVEISRPLFQGDVFAGVSLLGISDAPQMAIVISHPCSMRSGANIAEYVTLAVVEERSSKMPLRKWSDSFFRAMPLPGLVPSDEDQPFRFVNLNLLNSVRSSDLDRRHRIACLSEYGVQLLQQRHIFNSTRVVVDSQIIYRELAPVFAELELGFDWASAATAKALPTSTEEIDFAERAEADFQSFMGAGDSVRRQNLKDETKRSLVRTEVRREIQHRFG